jgi:ribonuclease T2
MTTAMTDIMWSGGLAWYQWNKHGRCTGLSAPAYFALSREAFSHVAKPDVFAKLDSPITMPAHVVEAAFFKGNPNLEPDMITVTCRAGRIAEPQICL